MTSTNFLKKLRPWISFLFWMILWQVLAMMVGKELIFPSPFAVLRSLRSLIPTGAFWNSIFRTILRILFGYGLGILFGSILAFFGSISSIGDTLITPFMRMIRSTPVASFIILAMLWTGKEFVPILMAMIMVAPIIYGNVRQAYQDFPIAYKEVIQVYRIPFGLKWMKFYLPYLFSSFKAAVVTSLGLAWKAGIAAEVLSQPTLSIGTNLYYSKVYLETSELFAWTLVVIVLSYLFELVLKKLMKGESHG